jgi:uncharacterized protein YyaL (SSP411 family)
MPARNRLGEASSPYLLQHAANPVNWFEWGEDAFAAAHQRGVPVLLSVGYATCHWCHVMAHESFEDAGTADLMNQWFVSIKVDREERPDVDRVYMDAVQAMTGRGGWPMTVFLTPDGEPFFAGTYFPSTDRPGHPSFRRVLEAIHEAWEQRRPEVEAQGRRLAATIAVEPPALLELPGVEALQRAYAVIRDEFDPRFGGFGGAPKFPQAPTLEFLLRLHDEPWASEALPMVVATLRAMAGGGIRDHVGGGFARYSVDAAWAVPHFEKMLYDNAQLLRLYAHTAAVGADPSLAAVAAEIAAYLQTDLGLAAGGFASGEDADSEGAEGTFYVFTHDEVTAAAGAVPGPVLAALGVTPAGNFEGSNVLSRRDPGAVARQHGLDPEALEAAIDATLAQLRVTRRGRPRPLRDDKVIAAWNGMAVRALAEAAVALGNWAWLDVAQRTARFVLDEMRVGGRLHRSWRGGRLGPPGFCDDYAAMALGCFALYQATGDESWFRSGAELTTAMVDRFADAAGPGFFATAHDAEPLVARPKNLFDLPAPSDNSVAAEALLHMAAFTGESQWWDRLEPALRLGTAIADRHPAGAAHHLAVLHTLLAPPLEVAIVGADRAGLLAVVREKYHPRVFLAQGDGSRPGAVPLLHGRTAPPGAAVAYVCRDFVCDAPIADPTALRRALS